MKRSRAPLALALLGLLAVSARPALAAMGIAVSVSPAEGVVGRPVEVLLRTFAPFGSGSIDLPVPSGPYPAPSGHWNVLYPFPDYPFDVLAEAEDRSTIAVVLARDSTDATLWRGSFTPLRAGTWTIRVRNFPVGSSGASAKLQVASGEAIPLVALVGVAGLLAGVLVGLAVGRSGFRRFRLGT